MTELQNSKPKRDVFRDRTLEEKGLIEEIPEWIRPYLKAVYDFVQISDPKDGAPVPVVVATPERPFADEALVYEKGGKLERRDTIPLPVASLMLSTHLFDASRYQGFPERRLQRTSDSRAMYQVEHPTPQNFIFEFDLRTKASFTMWRLEQEFESRFKHGATVLWVDLGPIGVQRHHMTVEGPVDNSDLEPGEARDRSLRKTWTLTVEGWLVKPVVRVPTVRKTALGIVNVDNDESLGEIVLEEG